MRERWRSDHFDRLLQMRPTLMDQEAEVRYVVDMMVRNEYTLERRERYAGTYQLTPDSAAAIDDIRIAIQQ
jgi:hypothetical protein